jgi:hypothetical protein
MSSVRFPRVPHESAKGVLACSVELFAVVAVFRVLEGLDAMTNDNLFVQMLGYPSEVDLAVWGWLHLSLGVIGVAVAIAILRRSSFGYTRVDRDRAADFYYSSAATAGCNSRPMAPADPGAPWPSAAGTLPSMLR